MVITLASDTRNRAATGSGFDGVVRIAAAGEYATGVLLQGGQAILTAAHLFTADSASTAEIRFETISGIELRYAAAISLHPGYDANANNDLAIVWLSQSAPLHAERYDIYRLSDEIGQTMIQVGYGASGTGYTGKQNNTDTLLRLQAENQFDSDIGTLKAFQGSNMAWNPIADSQLVADFDDGTSQHDALGLLIDTPDLGLGQNEGLIAPGDSGGPAFIDGKIAGVASYTARLSRDWTSTDIDSTSNSSFGEIAAWQRASYYQQWINQTLREALPNAPSTESAVSKEVSEGNSGTTYAYFLLKFAGLRPNDIDTFSVNYTTRDGSAKAGEDYLAINGQLNIYPDEAQVLVPVEIMGDTTPEANENFYLDVTNPNGNLGRGIVTLTAVRTILDDDPPL